MHPTPQPLRNNIWEFLGLISPGRAISHVWAMLTIWRFLSLHFPTPVDFRKRDERSSDQLLVWRSQLEPHKLPCPGSDRQDIPFYWEEMKLKIQVWAHFFLGTCESTVLDVCDLIRVPREERRSLKKAWLRHGIWWASLFGSVWFLSKSGWWLFLFFWEM